MLPWCMSRTVHILEEEISKFIRMCFGVDKTVMTNCNHLL